MDIAYNILRLYWRNKMQISARGFLSLHLRCALAFEMHRERLRACEELLARLQREFYTQCTLAEDFFLWQVCRLSSEGHFHCRDRFHIFIYLSMLPGGSTVGEGYHVCKE